MIIHDLTEALGELVPPVAVDTEFHAEHRLLPKLLLVQLRDASGRTLLIDALDQDLRPLGEALDGVPLLAHAPTHDLQLLVHHAGLRPGRVTDPQVLAGFAGLGYPTALGNLTREVLGVELPSGQSLTNWARRPLTEPQLAYARADVEHLHALCEALASRLSPDRLEMAAQATDELVREALAVEDPETAWEGIPAARVLDGTARDALRRLAAWRSRRSQEANQPPWQVASDAVLVDLARRRPADAKELAANRKFPKRLTRDHADELLALVAQASARPDGWPDDRAAKARVAYADAWLDAWSKAQQLREGIAPRLLMPPRLRQALSRSLVTGAAIPEVGWRGPLIPDLSRLVIGAYSFDFPNE